PLPPLHYALPIFHVLPPIRFESTRRNEVGSKLSPASITKAMKAGSPAGLASYVDEERQQRAATILRDVGYVIEAHFELTDKAGPDDTVGKHLDIFNRRARKGQCFHAPCMGVREFPACFALIEHAADWPEPHPQRETDKDLGWMLHDIDFAQGMTPRFFRARLANGIVEVPPWQAEEVKA